MNGIVLSPPGNRPKMIVSPSTANGTPEAGPVRTASILPSGRLRMMRRRP